MKSSLSAGYGKECSDAVGLSAGYGGREWLV
jgi:hypothetical protein